MQTLQIAATGHSLNYLPEYVAVENGYFKEEGLDVSAIVPEPWDQVIDEIENSTSHFALGGIWVPTMYHGHGKALEPFAQLSARCPMAIVGRHDKALKFEELAGSTILVPGGNGSSPGMFLELLLEENGVALDSVNMARSLSGKMMKELFVGGLGDYLMIDPISALKLARETDNFIVTHLSQSGGDIPWSVYYTTPGTAGDDAEQQVRFMRGLQRGMQYVIDHPAEEMRPLLTRLFPHNDIEDLVTLVDDYRRWGMWTTPRIDEPSYQRWQRGIAAGNLTASPIPHETLVNTGIADRASV
ncbi:ABC transporter substrate-binding protein [Vreelandella sp. TE19]